MISQRLYTTPHPLLHPTARSIELLPGEHWWGGVINDGTLMPFGENDYSCDMRFNIHGNQAAPLLLSGHGRYLWSESPLTFKFAEKDRTLHVASHGSDLVYADGYETLAAAYQAASRRHFPPSGRMPDPLNFTAPQYNSWIEMQYEPTQDKVLDYARQIIKNKLPPGIFMIDDNWFEDHGDWRFHPGRFPDPRALIQQMHEEGFRVVLWVSPFVSADSGIYRDLARQQFLVRDSSGTPVVRQWWNGQSALLDVTNPGAVRWLEQQLGRLMADYGVDGFKFDAGDPEYISPDDVMYEVSDGTRYCEAWARIGLRYDFNEYRACWKLAGQPLVQRLRDKLHAWGQRGLADIIPNGLAQGLAGYSFICPDMVGGGDIESFMHHNFQMDQELFVRTMQVSALFPILQLSVAPWRVLDQEHWDYCKEVIRLRQSFVPTILRLAEDAARTGQPILRHMSYVFPKAGFETVRDQFLLGNDLLVAPITTQGARQRPVVFPAGQWQDQDGKVIDGGCVRDVPVPLSRLLWYQRL